MGVSLVAEQARALGPQAHHFGGDGAIVGRAAVFAPRRPGAKGALAQIAAGRELQERLDARSRQGDRVLAGMAAVGGDARGAGDEKIRQAVEIGRVQEQEPVFFVREHILAELSGERRQPLGDRGQPRLGFGRGGRAGAGEIEMIALEHARLLGREPELRLLRLKRVDAREQSLVQIGVAAMARENRRDFALDRLQFVIGVGAGEIEKDARHFVEPAPAALERLDRIGEARRRRIGGDRVDLRARLAERGLEGRPEMARLEAVERRRLERPGPGFEQRVFVSVRIGHDRHLNGRGLKNGNRSLRGQDRSSRRRARASSSRYSSSVRSLPPVTASMMTSINLISSGLSPGGTSVSASRTLPCERIARLQFSRILAARSSSQSWMTLFRI